MYIGLEKKNINSNLILSTIENYYQYAKKGMVNILTNGSKNEKDWETIENKAVIEGIDSNNSDNSDQYNGSQKFEFNIVLWVVCLLCSIGVIYVIVVNGESAFKSMGIYKISKNAELSSDNTPELNSLDNPYNFGGSNNMYYIGGYDSNLYSD